ncbi:MAG: hypothetical protein L3J47_00310 [Sulfurovum sp.]|nr:hypothetical protein [Sulfurovum sp.]
MRTSRTKTTIPKMPPDTAKEFKYESGDLAQFKADHGAPQMTVTSAVPEMPQTYYDCKYWNHATSSFVLQRFAESELAASIEGAG